MGPTFAFLALGLSAISPQTVPKASPAIQAPTALDIAAQCPGIGASGLVPGLERREQDQAALRALADGSQMPPPLEQATAEFTAWSQRLAAISWTGFGYGEPDAAVWSEGVALTLRKYGWRRLEGGVAQHPASLQAWQRRFPGGNGARLMRVEFEGLPGLYTLRCGPDDLIALMHSELEGELAEGSPRPAMPAPREPDPMAVALASLDCTDPALIARLAATQNLDDVGPVIEDGLPDGVDGLNYQSRLYTWLTWRLRSSGLVSEDEIWAAQDTVIAGGSAPSLDAINVMFTALNRISEAQQAHDGAGICQASRDVLQGAQVRARSEETRAAAANAALEALARARGLDID